MKGAEATITFEDDHVLKQREPKKYRHHEIDEKIRKERTDTEFKLLKEAERYGVSVPEVEKVSDDTLELEKIEGEKLKEVLDENKELMEEFGKNVAYLHSADIIHGDLTTSNALVGEEFVLIDFGLAFRSSRVEDKAVDIHLLKQVLNSSHPSIAEECWQNFVEGYSEYDGHKEVLDQLKEVESRGRYK